MKRLGLIGGMSWESTAVYYKALNQGVRARRGGLHSADIILASLDFAPIAAMQSRDEWASLGQQLAVTATKLTQAGAELLLICSNTMHKVAPLVAEGSAAPLLHIGDASGQAIIDRGVSRVALLGTRFTMQEGFYREYLERHYGIAVDTPTEQEQQDVHQIIFDELCMGKIERSAQHRVQAIIERMVAAGAGAVLLGCTELGMLIEPRDRPIPILDTTLLHVDYALNAALAAT